MYGSIFYETDVMSLYCSLLFFWIIIHVGIPVEEADGTSFICHALVHFAFWDPVFIKVKDCLQRKISFYHIKRTSYISVLFTAILLD